MQPQITVSSFGNFSSGEELERVLRAFSRASKQRGFCCQLVGESSDWSAIATLLRARGLSGQVKCIRNPTVEQIDDCIAKTDIAVFVNNGSTREEMSILVQLMAAGVPTIIPAGFQDTIPYNEGFAALPNDAVLKVDVDECADALLTAFLERLIDDPPLRIRIGANARRYAAGISATGTISNGRSGESEAFGEQRGSTGRSSKLEGVDYKRGAIEYARNLAPSDRHHLFTKPFYNLADRHSEKYSGEGLDTDTHRHFCDFANMAVALALPAGARILDIGCGSGWLCEYFARFGYDVTGIDISSDLIDIARERLNSIPYDLDHESKLRYRFITHDIESSPLAETFDALICYDSLHHFEDERAVVRHLAAMLDYGGLLFVMEGARPPAGSSSEQELLGVMRKYATLEAPFSGDYLRSILCESGFAVIGDYASVNGLFERELIKSKKLDVGPSPFNYLLCKKVTRGAGEAIHTDSRKPGVLSARFTLLKEPFVPLKTGEQFRIHFEIENSGDTIWIVSKSPFKGSVRLGLKLIDHDGNIIDEIHGEPALPRAMAPGERVRMTLDRRAPAKSGDYTIKLDLLDQDICWFEQVGSEPLYLKLSVRD